MSIFIVIGSIKVSIKVLEISSRDTASSDLNGRYIDSRTIFRFKT